MGILSCFRPTNVTLDGDKKLSGCIFCDASVENGFNIVYEDDNLLAFKDRSPAAEHHYLVIPKRHVESVRTLRDSDASLVKSMQAVGHELLDKYGIEPSNRKMGFHIPPFNSVYHLHLHVQGLPYQSKFRAAHYPYRPGNNTRSKGLTWFAEVNQTIDILEKGKHVGVLPV